MRARRVYRAMLLVAGALTLALVLTGYGAGTLKRANLATVDARFSVRGAEKPPPDVVFVKIDDDTFNHYPKQPFPFRRGMHGRVIRNLSEAGAKVIAYDVQFTEPSAFPEQDNI